MKMIGNPFTERCFCCILDSYTCKTTCRLCAASLRREVINMAEGCSHNCGSCSENCDSRQGIQKAQLNPLSSVKRVIGVVSGKGGVGKSLVTSLLAVQAQKQGLRAAILDADITGPSIPKMFGIHRPAYGSDEGVPSVGTKSGIQIMSTNLLLENESDPVLWRGPIIAGFVEKFWSDVIWQDVDVLFVDMPPGTGDVALTVFQSLPVDGIVIVTSPQELVEMIVGKAVGMAERMHVPVLALVENMSYARCPHCGEKMELFGPSRVAQTAKQFGIETYASLPIISSVAKACDDGRIEEEEMKELDPVVTRVLKE